MASQSSTSSVFTGVLMAGIVIAGAAAIYLFVNQSNLPSAEQNTLAQAQGPLPPPARLRTLAQPAQQQTVPEAPPVAEQISAPSHAHGDWKGQWGNGDTGSITITPTTPGNYDLELQWNEETSGSATGTDSGNRIVFVADGQRGALYAISPNKVMVDNLIGSKECLQVESGDVFCR